MFCRRIDIRTKVASARRIVHRNHFLVGVAGSSWRSADPRSGHGRDALRCKNEDAIQRADAAVPAHDDVDSGQTQHHRLDGLRFTRLRGGLVQQASAQGEVASPSPIGEHAVMAQPRESARKHMQEEAADELAGFEPHHLALVAVRVVAPAEADLLAIEIDEPMVGDGGLV